MLKTVSDNDEWNLLSDAFGHWCTLKWLSHLQCRLEGNSYFLGTTAPTCGGSAKGIEDSSGFSWSVCFGKVGRAKPHGVIYRGHPWSGLVPRNSGSLLDVGQIHQEWLWSGLTRPVSPSVKSQPASKYGRQQDFYQYCQQHSYCPPKSRWTPKADEESRRQGWSWKLR